MFQSIADYIQSNVLPRFVEIAEARKAILNHLASYIMEKIDKGEAVNLIFICTHNSRRSHLAHIWAQVATHYFKLPNIYCFSGGTESTAVNENIIKAIKKAGFNVTRKDAGSNPTYFLTHYNADEPITLFSKVYDDPANSPKNFAAIMVCDDADENCPLIPGAEKRISLNYEDPKKYDGTDLESIKYDERCREIATEMFYLFAQVQKHLS